MKDISIECLVFLCKTYLYSALAVAVIALLYVLSWDSNELTYVDPVKVYSITPEVKSSAEAVIVQEVTGDLLQEEEYNDSLEYIACCVEAEAGNQSELGKRLVCDVILNRFNQGEYSSYFEVIDEPNQFKVVENGSIETVNPTDDTYRIIAEELENQTNTEVLYFRTDHYHSFGTPLFKEDDHYFSK